MYTKIKTKDGDVFAFTTQQYEVGLYVMITDDKGNFIDQFGSDLKEEEFHNKLKEEYTEVI